MGFMSSGGQPTSTIFRCLIATCTLVARITRFGFPVPWTGNLLELYVFLLMFEGDVITEHVCLPMPQSYSCARAFRATSDLLQACISWPTWHRPESLDLPFIPKSARLSIQRPPFDNGWIGIQQLLKSQQLESALDVIVRNTLESGCYPSWQLAQANPGVSNFQFPTSPPPPRFS